MTNVRVAGRGRAGGALAGALTATGGWDVELVAHEDASAEGVDLLVLAVPDGEIAPVAAAVPPVPTTVVAHLAGSLGLDVLAPHERRAAIHPLLALSNAELGAERLRSGAWFAIAGDPIAAAVVEALGGRSFEIADADRAAYHAAACIASNHLVALLAQTQRVASGVGAPFDAYLDLVQVTLDNVRALGPTAALTGPAARGDTATIARHLAALAEDERPLYAALAEACRVLGQEQ
ncbi:MAG: hypothetical protein QOE63_619 [Acidimicrobiaceae bacterium]